MEVLSTFEHTTQHGQLGRAPVNFACHRTRNFAPHNAISAMRIWCTFTAGVVAWDLRALCFTPWGDVMFPNVIDTAANFRGWWERHSWYPTITLSSPSSETRDISASCGINRSGNG